MEKIFIKGLNINIYKGDVISIVGPSNSGKTNLLKKISGRINNEEILIDDKSIKYYDLEYKRKNIVTVFNDDYFKTENILSELKYYLNFLEFTKKEIDKRIDNFVNYFKLEKIINLDINELSLKDKFFIKILSLLIINPKLFCVDDLFTYLDIKNKNKIFKYIKDNNITLLFVTTNVEEIIFCNKLLILNNYKRIAYDEVSSILKQEDKFNAIGYNMPFIYDINNLLKSYELIDRDYLVNKELVDKLWK